MYEFSFAYKPVFLHVLSWKLYQLCKFIYVRETSKMQACNVWYQVIWSYTASQLCIVHFRYWGKWLRAIYNNGHSWVMRDQGKFFFIIFLLHSSVFIFEVIKKIRIWKEEKCMTELIEHFYFCRHVLKTIKMFSTCLWQLCRFWQSICSTALSLFYVMVT